MIDGLSSVVVELVGVDEEVPAEEAGQAEAEEETLGVDESLHHQHEGGEDAEPLEQVPVGDVADELASGALGLGGVGQATCNGG